MKPQEIISGPSEWYLIASRGAMVLRVRPGMPLGETSAGELSFDRACARLELNVADDGGLDIQAVGDFELETPRAERSRHTHLERHRRAEIRLPNNVLQIDTDFADPAHAGDSLQIRSVARTAAAGAQPAADAVEKPAESEPSEGPEVRITPRPPRRSHLRARPEAPPAAEPGTADAGADVPRDPPERPAPEPEAPNEPIAADEPARTKVTPDPEVSYPPAERAAPRPEPAAGPAADDGPETRAEVHAPISGRREVRKPRIPAPLATALAGAVGIALALTFAMQRGDEPGLPPDALEALTSPRTDAEGASAAAAADPLPARTSPVAEIRLPAVPARLLDLPSRRNLAERQPPDRTVAAASADPVSDTTVEPALQPVTVPSIERRELPSPAPAPQPAAQTADRENATPVERDAQPPQATPPDPELVAELEEIGVALQTLATEMNRRRDLAAADLALSAGRLTTPRESSALVLYNRVLVNHPESAAAERGLQSVSQGLINRALAQLASGALADARQSLSDAVAAGADAGLVDDLRNEIDYRQQLIDSRN